MIRRSFERNAVLVGVAALVLAGSPVLAATGAENAAAAPRWHDETCTNHGISIQALATIDDATDGTYQCLGLSLEGGRIKAIRVETHRFASADRQADSEQVEVAEFSLPVVESRHGAVLDGVPGHDAIILRGHFSDPPVKAELVTTYLFNGFTSEYRSCRISLDRTPGVGWRLINRFDQTVSRIVVTTRQIPVIGTYGIANLEGACTEIVR
jgi:hypothetical protein